MSEPICYVMVGLPGLGKSTIVNGMYKDVDTFIYSTDQFIEEAAANFGKTYNEAFEDNIKAATESMNALLDDAIKEQRDIIWDQTNLGEGKRKKIINRMKQAGYQVRCECIIPPEAGWFDDQKAWAYRLRNRPGKTIPQNILTNMIESFTVPTVAEGFDMITFYNMHGALLGIDYGVDE
jgi:tRNA uridine 5-carbamoylmethylation protein Kti12